MEEAEDVREMEEVDVSVTAAGVAKQEQEVASGVATQEQHGGEAKVEMKRMPGEKRTRFAKSDPYM